MPVTRPTLDVTVAVHDKRWNTRVPGFAERCDGLVHQVIGNFADRVPDSGGAPLEIACILTNDAEVHDLNLRFRGKDRPTNVLSFVADPDGPREAGQPYVVGDVIVSLDTLEREAEEQQKSLSDHATHMIVHGIMHLLGFDHDDEEEATAMESLETRLLATMGIAAPYAKDQPV